MEDEEIAKSAAMLEAAVVALLDASNAHRQDVANQWVSAFVSKPQMWTVALYLAFPPNCSALGQSSDVKFFVLNLLLSKLRSDWIQLDSIDAHEIFEVLLRQVPENMSEKFLAKRICVVVSACAAVAGADACYQLVSDIIDRTDVRSQPAVDIALELLTALAEETLQRSRALSMQVMESIHVCYPSVLSFLQTLTEVQLIERKIICFERWLGGGITLSEIYSEYPTLFNMLLISLGSDSDSCVIASSSALSELVSAVDCLPERDAAVRAVISALLGHKSQFNGSCRRRSHALCCLLSAIGTSEPALIFRGGPDALLLIEWMIDATGRGGDLGIEGATIAASAWPRFATVSSWNVPRTQIFLAVFQALAKVATYPYDDLDDDDFEGFRHGIAKDALVSCFKVLRCDLISYISENLLQGSIWQHAEFYLYTVSSLQEQIIAEVDTQAPVINILKSLFVGEFGGLSLIETVSERWPCGKLIRTAATLLRGFSEWIALHPIALEKAVNYSLRALSVPDAKSSASESLRELCRSSAPHLAAARALSGLMGACETAITSSLGGLESKESAVLIEGLAAVAAALPSGEAEATIKCLTVSAVTTIQRCSVMKVGDSYETSLANAVRLLTAVVDVVAESNPHPVIPVLQEIWGSLDILATKWATNSLVADALCDLWRVLASRVGLMMKDVLPKLLVVITDMFKQHLVPSCVHCVSSIVALTSSSEITPGEVLSTPLREITSVVEVLQTVVSKQQEAVQLKDNAFESLGAVCSLGSNCLRHIPHIFVPSESLAKVFSCAIGVLKQGDSECAVQAAKFLSFTIFHGELNDDAERWRLSQELESYVNEIIVPHIPNLVEVVIKYVSYGQLTIAFREALTDILYSLAKEYPVPTEAVLVLVIKSPELPVRHGVLNDASKQQFVAAAIRRATRSRRVFQELVSDFSQAVQGVSPTDVLFKY